MIELIIFDCDGVLIDSEVGGCQTEAKMLSSLGFKITYQDIVKRFTGMKTEEMYRILQEEQSITIPDNFEDDVMQETLNVFAKTLKPIKGIKQFLKKNTLPVCIASGSKPERLESTLKITKLYDFFAPHIFSTNLVRNGKPAPDIFYYCAEKMLIAPVKCLVVEDSPSGIKGAKKAGMNVIGFTGGSHCQTGHNDVLKDAGARCVFSDMKDLAQIIADIP
ncbi:MAG: HAD family hydrolase [Alphaproteobacteria bacterium]